EKRAGKILKNGVRESQYECRHHNNGEISVILRDKASGDIIAYGEKRFTSPFQAEEEIKDLVTRLTRLRSGAPWPNTYLQRLPDSDKNARRRIVEDYQSRLQAIVKDEGSAFLRRRNRFLDHLLARFNEAFDNDSLLRCDPRNDGEPVLFYRELVQWKIEFLKRYVDLSSGRGRGLNCLQAQEEETEDDVADFSAPKQEPFEVWRHRSGLEQRLYLLLGLHGHFDEQGRYQPSKRPLLLHQTSSEARLEDQDNSGGFREEGLYIVEHILLRPLQSSGFDCRGRMKLDESGLCLECPDPDTARQWVEDILGFGADPRHYRIESDHGGYYSVLSGEEKDLARGCSFNSESEALEAQDELSERILQISQRGKFGPSATPVKEDFYSFRISIFLPNWTKRLANKGFRHFAENLIRENCPAHIAYRCYWLDKKTFQWFETLYWGWESAKLNPVNDPSELDLLSNSLKGFIEWLNRNYADEGESRMEPDRQEAMEQGDLPRKLKDTIKKLERRRSRHAH
ncbi:MAG: hypothetical protein PHE55_08360, partial [Methylococcaceae bacterium]|nr:hypothetical protein [Methylococcaceae bacterium]